MKLFGSAARTAALWLVLMIAQVAGGVLFFHGPPAAPARADGPLGPGQSILEINLIDAVLLAALAEAMRLRGLKLGLTLGAVFFWVESGLSAIEGILYAADLHMPAATSFGLVAGGLLRGVLAGAAIAFLWRGDAQGEARALSGLVWKFPLIAAVYVVCYFTAGYEIAWRSAAVRAFYPYIAQHHSFALVLLPSQFGRGLIWCGLAWLLARGLSRPAWRTALLTGLAFSLWMDLPLLFPSTIQPWPVRAVHFVEIGASNLLSGVLAALSLLAGARRPVATASPAASAA
jgi:hypothetical protein